MPKSGGTYSSTWSNQKYKDKHRYLAKSGCVLKMQTVRKANICLLGPGKIPRANT